MACHQRWRPGIAAACWVILFLCYLRRECYRTPCHQKFVDLHLLFHVPDRSGAENKMCLVCQSGSDGLTQNQL